MIVILAASCSRDDGPESEALAAVAAYVQAVSDRVAAKAAAGERLSVFIDPSKQVRIYLTAGEEIGVSTGFLYTAAGESELACAIAHEMAHRSDDRPVTPPATDRQAVPTVEQARWTQQQEIDADLAAADACWQAGYDPRALPVLLARLAALLQEEHPDEAETVTARADRLHASLDGQDRTGELGYRKYQSIIGTLHPGAGAETETDIAGRIIIGPVFSYDPTWRSPFSIYDEGKEAAYDFLDEECASRDLYPSNEFDAFGHCWYGCEGTREYGESTTWFVGTAREEWREIQRELGLDDHDSYTQDGANQGRGRSMADEEGTCYDLCADAARRGLLDFSAPERAYWDCEAGEPLQTDDEDADDGSGWPWTGQSWGDPHIVTGDGYSYSFQSAGEFLAIQSHDEKLTVQVRQAFWPGGRIVSQNVAAAVRIHGDTVGFYVVQKKLVSYVNGRGFDIGQSWRPLPGGGEVRSDYESVRLRWRDGSELKVRIFIDFLNVFFEPARARSGRLRGLLGNFDGVVRNDLATRDGTIVELPPETDPGYPAVLYQQFGNSWRVSPDESLFDYPDGMSAGDFQDMAPPDRVASVASLDETARNNAAAICANAGLRAQPFLDNCIVDVAVTGEERFAHAAADAASGTGHRDVSAVIPGAGTYVIDRFVASAGDLHFFQVLDLSGTLDLSRWELVSPDGSVVFGPCVRCNQPGANRLPLSGVYVSRLAVSGDESGRIRTLSQVVPAPQAFSIDAPATISPGQPAAGAGQIERAGAEDVYRLRGTAGETLHIVLTARDQQLYFGEWSLQAPGGAFLFSGIMPNPPSLPLDVEFPETGTYTLRVTGGSNWPSMTDAGYGEYRIQLD